MKKGIDIYNYDGKFEATVRNMRASKITEQNKKLIKKFYNFCFANGISKPRRLWNDSDKIFVEFFSHAYRIGHVWED